MLRLSGPESSSLSLFTFGFRAGTCFGFDVVEDDAPPAFAFPLPVATGAGIPISSWIASTSSKASNSAFLRMLSARSCSLKIQAWWLGKYLASARGKWDWNQRIRTYYSVSALSMLSNLLKGVARSLLGSFRRLKDGQSKVKVRKRVLGKPRICLSIHDATSLHTCRIACCIHTWPPARTSS